MKYSMMLATCLLVFCQVASAKGGRHEVRQERKEMLQAQQEERQELRKDQKEERQEFRKDVREIKHKARQARHEKY